MTRLTLDAHLELLARISATLETPDEFDASTRHVLMDDIDRAAEHFMAWPIPWPIDIHFGAIDHGHGVNHYLAHSRPALDAKMAEFCRENWFEINDKRDPNALDDSTVVNEYFNRHPEEYISTHVHSLAPEPLVDGALLMAGQVLPLSSRHLSPGTCHSLFELSERGAPARPLIVADTALGWFVPTALKYITGELPDDLDAVLRFARDHGAAYLLLSTNGELTEALPLYY